MKWALSGQFVTEVLLITTDHKLVR